MALLLEPAPTGDAGAADQAAPPPDDPVTRRGDVWQLDRHRLICGVGA